MDLTNYRKSEAETARISDLISLLPGLGGSVLDVGAREGFISKLLLDHFAMVTALDLSQPDIGHERIRCVKGDVTALEFADGSFDLIFCTEVLEHLPTPLLAKACSELSRVSKDYLLIGVPYKQDIRVGRTTCGSCGKANPPYGHVNSFDEHQLLGLFPGFAVARTSFVGETASRTNSLSCILMDMAGNPYGTYSQEEPCIYCGETLTGPQVRRLWQKVLTKFAYWGTETQNLFASSHPSWIHLLLRRQP